MKNKFFLGALLAACLAGCQNSIPEVDVRDLANQMAPEKFEATPLRTRMVVADSRMTIDEWRIIDVETKKIQHTCRVWGDGVDSTSVPAVYTYAPAGLAADNNGMNFVFTGVNVEEVLDVLYWGNGILVNGDTILNTTDDIESVNTLAASFPNNTWAYVGNLDSVFTDVVVWDTVYSKNVKYWDEALNRYMLRKDTIVEKKEHTFVSKLPLTIDSVWVTYASAPEKNELTFVGINYAYKHTNVVREEVKDTIVTKVPKDSVHVNGLDTIIRTKSIVYSSDAMPEIKNVEYKDNWYFSSFTSTTRFKVQRDGESTDDMVNEFLAPLMSISGYNLSKGTITIGKYDYKLVKD